MDAERMARLDRLLNRALDEGLEAALPSDPVDARLLRRLHAAALGEIPGLDESPLGHESLSRGLNARLHHGGVGAGTRIGPFEIDSTVASGGMGTVFRAHRVDGGFEQYVALKLLSASEPDPVLFQLFQRERQLLAQLDHPGIARLIDGGLTEDWQPWFAMEYIEGLPLHEFADSRRLSVAQRIELVIQVCEAIDHAHRRLVIHRDIKPGNLLVDESGRIHVVDFGLGRRLAEEAVEGDPGTTIAAGRLTPQYASPEQARGEAISVASDVYQLGLVLYRLLCGDMPYETTGLGAYALAEVISGATIHRPSERWLGRDAETIARELFGQSARSLRRALRGDIDNIVLTALQRRPADRYAGARELGEDLKDHLAHQPVAARAATRRYRLGRFVRRHMLGVGLGATALFVLSAGLVTLSLQSNELERQRDRALATAERNEQLAGALAGMVRLSDASGPIDQLFTVGERLAQYRDYVATELSDDPLLQSRLLAVLGQAFQNLRYWDQARSAFERALELRNGLGDNQAVEVDLNLSLAESRAFAGDLDGAWKLLDGMLARNASEFPARTEADILYQRGYLKTYHLPPGSIGFSSGIEDLERALALYRADSESPNADIALTMHTLGMKHPDPETAVSLMEGGIEMAESIHGDDRAMIATRLAELALLHDRLGKHDDAVRVGRRAYELHVGLRGPTHPESLTILSNLAGSLRESGRLAESVSIYERLHELRERVLPDDHLLLAYTAHGLGNTYRELGDHSESERWLREALRLCLAHDSPNEAVTRINLSKTLEAAGSLDAAARQQQAAIDAYRRHHGDEHPALPEARERLESLNARVAPASPPLD
ncbi:MAG: serine/threonine-protein kinase [Wenzhouxiangella sp.]|jgi:serine/threonine-protein kinase|nr:serine/threonine-protein kinase [Wenzhouxiangella sp.]